MAADDAVLEVAVGLGASLDALAALAAHLRLEDEALDADERVRAVLAGIAHELTGGGPMGDPAVRAAVVGMARAFFSQGAELVANPGRSGSWDQVDDALLNGIGRLSGAIAGAVLAATAVLPGLGHRLGADDGSFLDVGTGTGWLAIAMAQTFPTLAVTGVDLFAPALELATANVAAAGQTERITLQLLDVRDLNATRAYDAVWLPMPFLPPEVVPAALDAAHRCLKPGGWVLPGTFAGPDGRLAQLLVDLRTVRAGGHPWQAAELMAEIAAHGFADVQEVPRSWAAPVHLFAGRRPVGDD